MDLIEPILGIAKVLCALCEEVKANRKRCNRLKERVRGLANVLTATSQAGDEALISDQVCTALCELQLTLESAAVLVKKYTSDKQYTLKRLKNIYEYGDEFMSVNDRLNDAFQILSLNLQVHVDQTVTRLFQAQLQSEEDEKDRKEDCADTKRVLESLDEKMEALSVKTDTYNEDVKKLIKMIHQSENIPNDIRKIISKELDFDFPKKAIMKTDISEVFKGEYKKYPVAIKRYLCQKTVIPSDVLKIFEKEIETMESYSSPYILRMFGICFQEGEGLIVMEYCEMGGLRKVLDNARIKLSWSRKARMCLDATQGIYRLHQSEQRSKVHGGISSDNYMVAEGYKVKLGGLELASTETSMKKNCRPSSGSLRYRSPEQLSNVHHPYGKACEIYSLGMVLFEIATRKIPLQDCVSHSDIYKRVCNEKQVLEPLPDDCPRKLGDLINACRAYEPFDRPTAGVLLDKLRQVVEQLKEEWED